MPQIAPKPDPETGEPRPPRAPLNVTPKSRGKTNPQRAQVPAAPAGEGPVLEWYQESSRDSILTGLLGSLVIAAFGTLKDGGFGWMDSWGLWFFVLLPIPVFYLYGRKGGFSAGAEWFATSEKTHVRLYELTEVTVNNPAGLQSWGLELHDEHGGSASVSLRELQQNQALWDLVYNGIAHSVLRGAATANERALEMLKLRE
mgnify:CR=1 FL=1